MRDKLIFNKKICKVLINPLAMTLQMNSSEASMLAYNVVEFIENAIFLDRLKFSDIINKAAYLYGWEITPKALETHCQILINNSLQKGLDTTILADVLTNANDISNLIFKPVYIDIDLYDLYGPLYYTDIRTFSIFEDMFFFNFIYIFILFCIIFKIYLKINSKKITSYIYK